MIPALPPRGTPNRHVVSAHVLHRYASSLVSEVHKHAILTGTSYFLFKAAISKCISCSVQWEAVVLDGERAYQAKASELASVVADCDKLVSGLKDKLHLQQEAARKRIAYAEKKRKEILETLHATKEELEDSSSWAARKPKKIRSVNNGR